MRYKSNKKTINRKNKRRSKKNNHSRKRYSKRQRKRYKSRRNKSRRNKSRRNKSRRNKRTGRKRKSLKGGMFEKVGGALKKKQSLFEKLLHTLEAKLCPRTDSKLEHVERILTKDVGFILASLQHLEPPHFLEKIQLLKNTSELVCYYSHKEGKSFYEILNDQDLTETAMKSKEAGKAFKVCNALHVCLNNKLSDQDFLHFDLFNLQFSMPFHQMMMSFKQSTHKLLEGHHELQGFIEEVTDGYAHMKEHLEEKEKELMGQLKGRLEIDVDQIKQLIRKEIDKLEKEIGTEIKDEEQKLAKVLVKIKESDTFEAFEGHLKEGDEHLEDIKKCMQHIALTEQINAMHLERDKIQLFSLLMIGCICVQRPLQVVKGIYEDTDEDTDEAIFQKRESKIMAMILSGVMKTIGAIGNPDNILKITVQALNHTIQKNPTAINQNEEIQKLVDEYMEDKVDQTDKTSQTKTSDKLEIILSRGLSSKEEERERFSNFVEGVVANLVHHYKYQILGMLTDIARGAATVGSLDVFRVDDDDDED